MTQTRQELGRSGEDAVAAWYEGQGYLVVVRNWRCREGELDLVVRRGRGYGFCEGKTPTSDALGAPQGAGTRAKPTRIRPPAGRGPARGAPGSGAGIRVD